MKIDSIPHNQIIDRISFSGSLPKRNYVAVVDCSTAKIIQNVKYYSEKFLPYIKTLKESEIEALGVQKNFCNLKEGVTFTLEKHACQMQILEKDRLWLRFRNINTGKVENSIFVQNNQISKTDTSGDELPEIIEFFGFKENLKDKEALLKSTLEEIDFVILKLRKTLYANGKLETQILAAPVFSEQVRPVKVPKKILSTKKKTFKRTVIPKKYQIKPEDGQLDEKCSQLAADIISAFNGIHEDLANIKNSRTRNLIKYSYDRLREGVAGSKVLDFSIKHPNIKSVSVNMVNDHYKRNLVITTKKIFGVDGILVITPDNRVFKTIPFGIVRDANIRKGKTPLEYYNQEEIDKQDFESILKYAEYYLKDYRQHLQIKIEKLNNFKAYHSTIEAGSMVNYSQTLGNIYQNLKLIVENFKNYHANNFQKTRFKKINDIDYIVYQGNPVKVYLNEITPDRKSVYIKFSDIKGEKSVQILIHSKGKVEKTYSIIGDKMLKFNAKHLNSRPHYDRDTYYYSQNEISQSGFEELIKVIDRHLNKVLSNLKEVIQD